MLKDIGKNNEDNPKFNATIDNLEKNKSTILSFIFLFFIFISIFILQFFFYLLIIFLLRYYFMVNHTSTYLIF